MIDRKLTELSETSYVIPNNQNIFGNIQSQIKTLETYQNIGFYDAQFYLTKSFKDLVNSSVALNFSNTFKESRLNVITGLELYRDKIITSDEYDELTLEMTPGLVIVDNTLINIFNSKILTINIPFEDVFISKKYDQLILACKYSTLIQEPLRFYLFFYDSINHDVYNDEIEWNKEEFFIYRTLEMTVNKRPFLHLYFDTNYHKHVSIPIISTNSIYDSEGYIIGTETVRTEIEIPSRFYNYNKIVWTIRIIDFIGFSPFIDVPYLPPIPRSSTYALCELFL
jgi:hypothetical protein